MNTTTLNSNIRIKELPPEVDERLNKIAARDSKYKHEIVREALIEYAERHTS